MTAVAPLDENTIDDGADAEISSCLNLDGPKSFFLYAGAGSGKTRSLVSAINALRKSHGQRLTLQGRKVGVITYTNAACDEIKQRLEYDPLVLVTTIHSFAWSLIEGYNADIREWLRVSIRESLEELGAAQAKGRAGTKIAADRARSIESKQRRLAGLGSVQRFIYSPTGENRSRDSLSHSEVIQITSAFLLAKIALSQVLVDRFPVLLIDESQDTNRHLLDALMAVQARHPERFCLGLFGDTMQRIYSDGKVGLEDAIPDSWGRPAKQMNHRCPIRIISLINRVREDADQQKQKGRTDKAEGFARLFVASNQVEDRLAVEAHVAARMAVITGDESWNAQAYKTLILEHHMAARRLGFHSLFEPLYEIDRFRTGLLDGTLQGITFFTKKILPLVLAIRAGDQFAAAAVVRSQSPLLDKALLKSSSAGQTELLRKAKAGVDDLISLWAGGGAPSCLDLLRETHRSGLFDIPESLKTLAALDDVTASASTAEPEGEDDLALRAWEQALGTSFEQITEYDRYIGDKSQFGTHQGVKGMEFPRVMVVIDDEEARGFLFSYEKLFGVKEKTITDRKNEDEGAETSISRTRRLFYVTCSRAEESLAVVAYTAAPSMVRDRVIAQDWFGADEIEMIGS